MSQEFVTETNGSPACDGTWSGAPTSDWRFPIYPWTGDNDYPAEACPLRTHNFIECTDLKWAGGILSVKAPIWDAKKSFDISHPTKDCLLYTSPSPRDRTRSRMPSSA